MQEIEIGREERDMLRMTTVVGIKLNTFKTKEERNEYVKNFKSAGDTTTIFKDVRIGEKLVIR
jgi:hypothetical protein